LNECRKEVLGLEPLSVRYWWHADDSDNDFCVIYAYSPTVVPPAPDWGPLKQVAGYWFLDGGLDYSPSEELAAFLEAGPPPVYVGFGSMVDHDREEMTRLVIEALDRTGQRGIMHSGWSELGSTDLPGSVLLVEDVPHDWLFPRMAAVIHHGGAGTTASGLRAGVPGIVVAFFGDQFFWGWRIHELGAGPRWIPRKQLTADGLASAIERAVTDEGIRERAAEVGAQIQTEDGVAAAIPLIERYAEDRAAM
jgi:UDP:flavonoid glycosyltransferase YjiC (YdhE family)